MQAENSKVLRPLPELTRKFQTKGLRTKRAKGIAVIQVRKKLMSQIKEVRQEEFPVTCKKDSCSI